MTLAQTEYIKAEGISTLVNRNYKFSHSYQWCRECLTNTMQAGGTKAHFTTEWQAVKRLGVHRRLVVDNGPGIPVDKMATYLNSFGGSGKTVDAAASNFGVGLKTSLLPWNTYGVVMLSRVHDPATDTSTTHMMWMWLDTDAGEYGIRLLDTSIGDLPRRDSIVNLDEWETFEVDEAPFIPGNTSKKVKGVDWTKVFPADQKSGFAFVLLGDNPTENTVLGDPNRIEDPTSGLAAYINNRFYDLPIEVTIDTYNDYTNPEAWPTTANGNITPIVLGSPTGAVGTHGLSEVLDKVYSDGNHVKGTVHLPSDGTAPAVNMHWWLYDKPTSQRPDLPTPPMAGIIHEAHDGIVEVYDLAAVGESTASVHVHTRMNQFVQVSAVRDRLAIMVEPIASEDCLLYPDQSRTNLSFEPHRKGAQAMQWDQWFVGWRENLPAPVKAAIDAYYEEQANNTDDEDDARDLRDFSMGQMDRLKEITASLIKRFSGGAPTRKAAGTSRPGTTSGSRLAKAKRTPKANPDSPTSGDDHTMWRGYVECKSIHEPAEPFAVRFDANLRATILNTAHPLFDVMLDSIVNEYVTMGRLTPGDEVRRQIIFNEVRRQARRHITLGGTQAYSIAQHNPTTRAQVLSDESLQSMLYGYRHIEDMCSKRLLQILHRSEKAPKKRSRLKVAA